MKPASLFSSVDTTGALPANPMLPNATDSQCRTEQSEVVSAVRQAQDELDDAIDQLRTMAALAQDRGDIETAFDFTRRMLAASRSRTAEHQDRLARDLLAAVELSLDNGCCYFAAEGDKARAASERKTA